MFYHFIDRIKQCKKHYEDIVLGGFHDSKNSLSFGLEQFLNIFVSEKKFSAKMSYYRNSEFGNDSTGSKISKTVPSRNDSPVF